MLPCTSLSLAAPTSGLQDSLPRTTAGPGAPRHRKGRERRGRLLKANCPGCGAVGGGIQEFGPQLITTCQSRQPPSRIVAPPWAWSGAGAWRLRRLWRFGWRQERSIPPETQCALEPTSPRTVPDPGARADCTIQDLTPCATSLSRWIARTEGGPRACGRTRMSEWPAETRGARAPPTLRVRRGLGTHGRRMEGGRSSGVRGEKQRKKQRPL